MKSATLDFGTSEAQSETNQEHIEPKDAFICLREDKAINWKSFLMKTAG